MYACSTGDDYEDKEFVANNYYTQTYNLMRMVRIINKSHSHLKVNLATSKTVQLLHGFI